MKIFFEVKYPQKLAVNTFAKYLETLTKSSIYKYGIVIEKAETLELSTLCRKNIDGKHLEK